MKASCTTSFIGLVPKAMRLTSRGFHHRRRTHADAARVAPGQQVVNDFPVLSAGPTPSVPLRAMDLHRQRAVNQSRSRTRNEFTALSSDTVTVDIHCVGNTTHAAWQHTELPDYAWELKGRLAFPWRAKEAFFEQDERIVGHAADPYHRIDLRQGSRHLVVGSGDRVGADTARPLALFESGFTPRWYVPRAGVDEAALSPAEGQTFCPHKGLCSYYDIPDARRAVSSYTDTWAEIRCVCGLVSFEPDKVEMHLNGARLRLGPGQSVISHGLDHELTPDEIASRRQA